MTLLVDEAIQRVQVHTNQLLVYPRGEVSEAVLDSRCSRFYSSQTLSCFPQVSRSESKLQLLERERGRLTLNLPTRPPTRSLDVPCGNRLQVMTNTHKDVETRTVMKESLLGGVCGEWDKPFKRLLHFSFDLRY